MCPFWAPVVGGMKVAAARQGDGGNGGAVRIEAFGGRRLKR